MLLNSEGPVKIDNIAQQLKVSNRTVRNDLIMVEQFLKDRELTLQKRPGIGIQLQGADQTRLQVANEVRVHTYSIEPYSPQERKNNILKRLFMSEGSVTIKKIAQELYVSNVTIQKDLENIEKWLKSFDLKLVRRTNYGIKIAGREENCRNAIANLIVSNRGYTELQEMLYNDSAPKIDYNTRNKLAGLINIDYQRLEKIVNRSEETMGYQFTTEAFASLVIHIAIAIKRLQDGRDIILSHATLADLKTKNEYQFAKQIADDIQDQFGIKLPDQEIGYILFHILGSKLQRSPDQDIGVIFEGEDDQELAIIMAKEIISIAQKALSVDFSHDKQALHGLVLHLRPTINRLEYDLNLRNPLLQQIKEDYPEIFGVAWIASTVFERHLGKKITEEEIGYIALHLGAAIERQKKPVRALVVCPSGMGRSQFLAIKLERHFKEIEISKVTSIITLQHTILQDIDLIISTVPVTAPKPVLVISPLLNQTDILKLSTYIAGFRKQPHNPIISKELIQINVSYDSKEAAIQDMCARLIAHGYVKADFEQSVLKRENSHSTEIGKGVAIPHGFPQSVNRSQIALAVLKRPVKWGHGEYVDIIFMLAVADIDVLNSTEVLGNLYKALDMDKFLALLRNAGDQAAALKLLEEQCYL
jgi:transcriptional antiterminator